MGRRLPEYDPETDGPYAASKRRREIFKRVYQQRDRWRALQEDRGMEPFITTPDGEDVYYGDLMVGFAALAASAPQQRRAFERICLREYTESAATAEILPDSQWSTPVQQYSEDGLKKMIAAYDAKQNGTWDPVEAVKKKRRTRKKEPVVSEPVIPEVPDDVQDETRRKFTRIQHLDWSVCSDENARKAEFIKSVTGLEITGQMVKAVAFLHKPWYHSEAEQATRAQIAAAKEQEKAKYAYETPEQREARFEAARRLKSMQATLDKAKALQDEVAQLRVKAGLNPETGEPVAAQ